jgi:hypothetical protein
LIKDNGDYALVRKNMTVPTGVSARDFLFKQNGLQLIMTNHDAELVVVESEDAKTLGLSYDEIKREIREKFSSHTVFPIVENVEMKGVPVGTVSFEERWVVALSSHEKKMYFFGDNPRSDSQSESKKVVFAYVPIQIKGTARMAYLWVVVDDEERAVLQDAVKREGVIFDIKGMSILYMVPGKQTAQEWVLATKIHFEHEKYDDIGSITKCVNSIGDVTLWRDYKNLSMVPDEVEAAIVTSGLFFAAEGFATFNMLVIGSPGCGKTFQMDVFAHELGTTVHAMEQSTLKGLVFSHQGGEVRGSGFGQKGVLLREKYVALLNEFLRVVVRAQQKAAQKDEMSRLFASLNDAVERKKNRARSSGNVMDAEGYCSCSMMTTDNDFPQLIQPFAFTMFEDSSYLRRYSILRLSTDTERCGKMAKVGIVNWKASIDKYLATVGLGGGRWARLMRFWRSQVTECLSMPDIDYTNIVRFAEVKKRVMLKKVIYQGREPVSFGMDDPTGMLYYTMLQADFSQLAISCQASAIIMGSTFRANGTYPKLERHYEDNVLATKMLIRLIEDMFKVIGPYVPKYVEQNSGVKRI